MANTCSRCKREYGGIFSSVSRANANQLSQLKQLGVEGIDTSDICQSCAANEISMLRKKEASQQVWPQNDADLGFNVEYKIAIRKIFNKFKIYSSNSYDGENMGFVVGYSTLGTGVFTEIASTFTDAFGVQSSSYKNKLLESEQEAKNDLILKAINLGATAIYNASFSVTEATSGNGILIVHFSGDAVKEKYMDADFIEFFELKNKD